MNDPTFENILAIETSTTRLRLALSFGGDRLVKSDDEVERSHGQILIRKIGNLFESANLDKKRLHGIVVSVGPGSFTGLRIGLAAAKGMAIALNIPVASVSHFDLAAYRFKDDPAAISVVVQVRRDEVLVGQVAGGTFDVASVVAVPTSKLDGFLHETFGIGVGLDLLKLAPHVKLVAGSGELELDPADLIQIGREKLQAGQAADLGTLEPLYLQKSQAEIRYEQRHAQQ